MERLLIGAFIIGCVLGIVLIAIFERDMSIIASLLIALAAFLGALLARGGVTVHPPPASERATPSEDGAPQGPAPRFPAVSTALRWVIELLSKSLGRNGQLRLAAVFASAVSLGGGAFGLITIGESTADDGVNQPPVVSHIVLSTEMVQAGKQVTITLVASDPDGDPLTILWSASYGSVQPVIPTASARGTYTAPCQVPVSPERIQAIVTDGRGGRTAIARAVQIVGPEGECP